jgi:hypothetical protein
MPAQPGSASSRPEQVQQAKQLTLLKTIASEVFPGKSQHDACLDTDQAENGSQVEKNNAELLLAHVVAPDQLEHSRLLQQLYTNLTGATGKAFVHWLRIVILLTVACMQLGRRESAPALHLGRGWARTSVWASRLIRFRAVFREADNMPQLPAPRVL